MAYGTQPYGTQPYGTTQPITVEEVQLRFKIYRMLLQRMRTMDEKHKGILKPFTEILDDAWEDLLYDRCSELPTLFEPRDIDARWARLQAPLVGFTPDLSMDPSTAELRRILLNGVEYWNDKPAEGGVIVDAIRMVTGDRFRVANYFDFRSQLGWTYLSEQLMDFDPNMISFNSPWESGEQLQCGGHPTYPNSSLYPYFQIHDLPGDGVFDDTVYRWLVVTYDGVYTQNIGTYEIEETYIGTNMGKLKQPGFAIYHVGQIARWKLVGGNKEFVTEVRLVDQGTGTLAYDNIRSAFTLDRKVTGVTTGAHGVISADDNDGTSGTLTLHGITGRFQENEVIKDSSGGDADVSSELSGVLNRDLLKFLMGDNDNTVRPMGERIDVVYINFLEQFHTANDLYQWTQLPDENGVSVDEGDGYAQFTEGYTLLDNDSEHAYWEDQCTVWKIQADTSSTIVWLIFYAEDEDDYYFVRASYADKTVSLYKRVAASNTIVGSAAAVINMKPGYSDTVRVDVATEGSDTRIRVKVNGELKIDEAVSPAAHTEGGVGAKAQASTFKLEYVEVNVLPSEVDRVGPVP